MISENLMFKPREIDDLKSIVNKKIICIKSEEPSPYHTIFGEVQLVLPDQKLTVIADYIPINYFGEQEETAVLTIGQPYSSKYSYEKSLNETVKDIKISTDLIVNYDSKEPVYSVNYPHSLIFELETCSLVLSKADKFMELMYMNLYPIGQEELTSIEEVTNWWYDPLEDEADGLPAPLPPVITRSTFSIKDL